MSSRPRRMPFCQVFKIFPLQNFDACTETDIETITKCIKIFQDPRSLRNGRFNFLETGDLYLICHFFAVYGDDIRETEFFDCEKLDGNHCTCFLKQISMKESHLLSKVLKLVNVQACTHCCDHNPASNISKILSQFPK